MNVDCTIPILASEYKAMAARLDALAAENERLRKDAERFEYLCRNMPGRASRILLGEMSDTADMDDWRQRIDAALAKEPTT